MIDVIVPVYRGAAQTERCLASVLAHRQATALEVVVVDDASPEPAIAVYLDRLVQERRISLLRNPSNVGFVHSVNRAMALHPDRDVVLLNSDTEVANDWLDRMNSAARDPAVATVTPFSNNATICSYPFEGWAGGVPGTLGLAALDRLFAETNAGVSVDIPTGVGFCMFVRRATLRAVGAFDAERFGRGYGEENDFCMRASNAGWRHVLACDVFVFHEGGVSFAEERLARLQPATDALLAVHPEYAQKVHDFMAADPAGRWRAQVDAARMGYGPDEARHVLAERHDEHERTVRALRQVIRERESRLAEIVAQLEHESARAARLEGVMGDRDAAIAAREGEIVQLRAGLAHAESLAFGRAEELERIRSSRSWRLATALARVGAAARIVRPRRARP